jgi:hypothetical protein
VWDGSCDSYIFPHGAAELQKSMCSGDPHFG